MAFRHCPRFASRVKRLCGFLEGAVDVLGVPAKYDLNEVCGEPCLAAKHRAILVLVTEGLGALVQLVLGHRIAVHAELGERDAVELPIPGD